MRVWIDALTPKQARLAAYLYERLTSKGFRVLVTTRDYDITRFVLERLGVEYISVGRHGGGDLKSKLIADLERALHLVGVVDEFRPDVLVSYPSPSALRVAFGLAMPSIVFTDSPHSIPAHLLTVPLADYLIYPSLIPRQFFERYASFKTRFIAYMGIDEIGWVREHKCNEDLLGELGLEKDGYVVVRLAETLAEYYRGWPKPPLASIIEELVRNGFKVVAIPRYASDYELVDELRRKYSGMIVVIWGTAVESLDLYCWARLVITGGATMAREAALMCKQALSFYPVYLNKVLEQLGFPLINYQGEYTPASVLTLIRNLLEEPVSCTGQARELIKTFETPAEPLLSLLEELQSKI